MRLLIKDGDRHVANFKHERNNENGRRPRWSNTLKEEMVALRAELAALLFTDPSYLTPTQLSTLSVGQARLAELNKIRNSSKNSEVSHDI